MQKYSTSERLACELVGLSREAYRYMPLPRDDEEPLRAEVIRMAPIPTVDTVTPPLPA